MMKLYTNIGIGKENKKVTFNIKPMYTQTQTYRLCWGTAQPMTNIA